MKWVRAFAVLIAVIAVLPLLVAGPAPGVWNFRFGFSLLRYGDGSRIDVRSVSRVGQGDAGANAARVRAYLARLVSDRGGADMAQSHRTKT